MSQLNRYEFVGSFLRPERLKEARKNYELNNITKEAYDEYFEGKEKAVAYILGKVKKYDNEKRLSDFHINVPPQSYFYLD